MRDVVARTSGALTLRASQWFTTLNTSPLGDLSRPEGFVSAASRVTSYIDLWLSSWLLTPACHRVGCWARSLRLLQTL